MTTDPALANLHSRGDRLAEIEYRIHRAGVGLMTVGPEVEWLIAEVKRLRATLLRTADAPCTHCDATWLHGERNTAHFLVDQVLPHPADDQHRQP